MNIAVVGSGNIASYFSKKFTEHNHSIVQVISTNKEHAQALATQFDCIFSNSIHDLVLHADVYLLAVKDDVLLEFSGELRLKNKLVLHTAGSITLQTIQAISTNVGSIWCMYSINKNHLPNRLDIPLICNASNAESLELVTRLASCISTKLFTLSDEQKTIAHLGAVFANNFANHLFTIGQHILEKDSIPFELLVPLIQNTVEKLNYSTPDKLQTGPAIRHDEQTIARHKQLLHDDQLYSTIYSLLTESIQKTY